MAVKPASSELNFLKKLLFTYPGNYTDNKSGDSNYYYEKNIRIIHYFTSCNFEKKTI
jgi:hypothetical protein